MPDEEHAKPGSVDELAALYPLPTTLSVRLTVPGKQKGHETREATVCELPIGVLAHIAKALMPMLEAIPTTSTLLQLAANHPEDLYKAIALAIDWDPADVRRMAGADFLKVTMAVWELNKDFFAPLLGSVLAGVASAIKKANRGANRSPQPGETLSPSSDATAASSTASDLRTDSSTRQ